MNADSFQVGDVILFSWNDRYGKLIKIYNRLKYPTLGREARVWTHAAIVAEVYPDAIWLYEALPQGFVGNIDGKNNIYTYEFLNNLKTEGRMCTLRSTAQLMDVPAALNKYNGCPYGWTDAVAIAFSLIGIPIRSTGANKLICSEAVARVLYDTSNKQIVLGYDKKRDKSEFKKPYDLITPVDLSLSKHFTKLQ